MRCTFFCLAHRLRLAARQLSGKPLVLLAQHRLALLRERG